MINSNCTGQVLAAKTAVFKDNNNQNVTYGKIQLLTKDMSGEFYSIQNIKVKKDCFGWLPDIEKQMGKQVTISLTQESYNGKTSFYIAEPLTKAS